MPKQHPWDQASQDIATWLDTESRWAADALVGGSNAPFSKPLSKADQLRYWQSKLFTPDGQPNDQGRKEVIAKSGVQGYVSALAELHKAGMTGNSRIYDAREVTPAPEIPKPEDLGLG